MFFCHSRNKISDIVVNKNNNKNEIEDMLLHNQEVRDLSSLELLAQAPSKSFVEQVFLRVFQSRHDGFTNSFIVSVTQQFYATSEENNNNNNTVTIEQQQKAHECLEAILFVIQTAIFLNAHSLENPEDIARQIFSSKRVRNFSHPQLMKLIVGIIKKHGPSWRRQTTDSLISLPKLQEMKWRIDMKSASQSINSMNAPTVVVELDILDNVQNAQAMPDNKTVQFELNRETLEIMLGGLTKIRDQLSAVK